MLKEADACSSIRGLEMKISSIIFMSDITEVPGRDSGTQNGTRAPPVPS